MGGGGFRIGLFVLSGCPAAADIHFVSAQENREYHTHAELDGAEGAKVARLHWLKASSATIKRKLGLELSSAEKAGATAEEAQNQDLQHDARGQQHAQRLGRADSGEISH